MNKETWTAVDQYYLNLTTKPDPRFEQILKNNAEAGLPAISISASHGRFFEILIRALGVKRILEIGTLGGFSTAWLAKGLPFDGKLISLEISPEHAAAAKRNLSGFESEDLIEIRVGDALVLLEELENAEEEPFDLIFIDAEKSQYPAYLEASLQLSRPGTLIIADNVVKHGEIINPKIDTPSRVGITEFHKKVAADPRLQATVLQTVGEKGYDGYSFILVDPA